MTAISRTSSWVAGVGTAVKEQLPMLALTAMVIGGGYLAEGLTGLHGQMRHLGYRASYLHFIRLLAMPLPIAFLWGRLQVTDEHGVWLQGGPGWIAAWRRFREVYLNLRAITAALLAGLMVAANINVFGTWKLAIPKIHPFDWDTRLSAIDKTVHFGHQPWELLRPFLAHGWSTNALDFAYQTWLPLLLIVCAWQAWNPLREVRARFFLTFILVWIVLGNVVATALSSAGPPFWSHVVGGESPYTGLFKHLDQLSSQYPLWAPIGQSMLWQLYAGASQTPYTGISAMPSLHVAMPVLYALVGWRTWKPLGVCFAVYGVVILLGSIHLGWHYAVDGYVSIAGVLALWWGVGLVMRVFRIGEHNRQGSSLGVGG